jgi:putative transposase
MSRKLFEPSSKLCTCGAINKDLKLSEREWTCSECKAHHDRDILASQNIKTFGLQKQNLIQEVCR